LVETTKKRTVSTSSYDDDDIEEIKSRDELLKGYSLMKDDSDSGDDSVDW
jgi:hypothetical protein